MKPSNEKLAKIVGKEIGKKAEEIDGEVLSYIDDLLEEIQAICIGADSPDAIKNGERTATTRFESDGYIEFWKKFKVGDIINLTVLKDGKETVVKAKLSSKFPTE